MDEDEKVTPIRPADDPPIEIGPFDDDELYWDERVQKWAA